MPRYRRAGLFAALTAAPLALAYRFALVYRGRAGFPRRRPPVLTPADLGLPFEETTVPSPGGALPAWFLPARGGRPGPGVVLVHGWESARDRLLPYARFLHAAGFHCLLFDVRGHGANGPELLPISVGEFAADASAALDALLARSEVTAGALLGHSLGGAGAILAAAEHPSCAAVVSVAAPADPRLLTRETFRLARLPIPRPFAHPLAWLTTRVYVRPRGHAVAAIDARRAVQRYRGPVLLVHGESDGVIPAAHLARLAAAARHARRRDAAVRPVETLVVPGAPHSWLYEHASFRAAATRFLSESLGGPLAPDEAAALAVATPCERPAEPETAFSAVEERPSTVRLLLSRPRPPAAPEPAPGPLEP